MDSLPDRPSREQMARVTAARPCPVCGKPDWCLIAPDGAAAICKRVESDKLCGEAGWFHRLTNPTPDTRPRATGTNPRKPPTDCRARAGRFARKMSNQSRVKLAGILGLPFEVIRATPMIGVEQDVFTFPEFDATGAVIGILRRLPDGRKRMSPGSRRGLSLPAGRRGWQRRVFVVEGPTDTLAMTAAGLPAVGRPSNAGGVELLIELFSDLPADCEIVVVGENDKKRDGSWPGREGAIAVAKALAAKLRRPVRVAFPSYETKDVRDWLTHPDRGDAPWPDRGAELARLLLDSAETFDSPTADQPASQAPAQPAGQAPARPSAADVLVGLATGAGVVLFHTPDQEAMVKVPTAGRVEVHPVRGTPFRRWLGQQFYKATGKACHPEAMATAIGTLEGMAAFDGEEHPVHLRVGPAPGGGVVIDLCDPGWRAVVVRPGGWEVAATPPVLFRRSAAMRPLPEPARGGNLTDLRKFLNVRSDDDWLKVVAWMAAALRPRGPYPLLHLRGEMGTAKTTSGRLIRRAIDPNAVDLKSPPREERDLAVGSRHGWLVCYDNLGGIPPWLSDALCRVATGGGFGTRTLYSNDEETHFDFMRPVMLTSIEDVIGQPDLLDRTLTVELAPIPDGGRRTEADLWAAYDAALPGIFGGLLDVVAAALARLPEVEAERRPLPRMADFAVFGEAVARVLGAAPGHFLRVLRDERKAADQSSLEGSPVALLLFEFVKGQGSFTGTMTALLAALNFRADEPTRRRKGWPANAQALSGLVRRIAPALRRVGVAYTSNERSGKHRTRTVTLTFHPDGVPPEEGGERSSAPSADDANVFEFSGLEADDPTARGSSAHCPPQEGSPATTVEADDPPTPAGEDGRSPSSAPNSLVSNGVNHPADVADDLPQALLGRSPHAITGDVEEETI